MAKKSDKKSITVKILLSPAGKFLLPYSVGEEVALDYNLGLELIDSKYAEEVKK
ncbi:hypothetical protein [Tenacibaculum sp. 190524A02b]|uniref:hypothetical protein n=1 Tax=Tenacibaculum vairaonense TaxID=3137860 RepID=UPI0031FAEAA9